MIYLKKNNETQIAYISKNGSYEGKKTYKEGYYDGFEVGLEEGKNNPYTTKGFFFENGEKELIYPVRIDRDTMLQISYLTSYSQSYVEISFYPMGNGCVLANSNDSYIVCAMRGDLLRVFIYNNLQFELPCKQGKWHTLRLYTDGVILDGEVSYFNTPYIGGSIVCACVNRGGNGFYRGLIQYMKGVEDEAVMYYISDLEKGGFKRLRSDNGISDWYENSFISNWGEFPILQTKAPLNSVFINVEGGNICPELTVLDVSENGRYEGAYSVVNVNVPDINGSYDEGYNNGYNDGLNAGGGSCNLGQLDVIWDSGWNEYRFYADNDGYDGYNAVSINAENALNEKYNEGYNDGKAEGGSCNIGSLDSDTNIIPHTDDFIYAYASDYGVDGWSYISIDYRPLKKEVAKQAKNEIVNKLQTLTITQNGVYTPTTYPSTLFDGDDVFGFAYADTSNAIELRFRVNGEGWIFGNNKVGLYAEKENVVTLYWFGYNASYYIEEDGINTMVIKPFDTENRVIVNGVPYEVGEQMESDTETTEIKLGGNSDEGSLGRFNLVYAKFWTGFDGYNNGDIPLFHIIPNEDGNVKSSIGGGDYNEVNNDGGGHAMYEVINEFEGWNKVNVNIPTEGGSCNLGELNVEWQSNWNENIFYADNDGYDGYNAVSINAENALNEKYNEGYEAGRAEGGGSCNLQEKWFEYNSTDELTDGIYVDVCPEEGYDGMSRVVANIKPIMDYKYNEGYNNAIANGANLTPSAVEKEYNTIALRTKNIHDSDIILDRTLLVGNYDTYVENGYISYTQNKNGIVITKKPEFSTPFVSGIENGGLNWNTIEYFYSYTITTFGENMTRDVGSNVMQIHLDSPIMNTEGADIVFRSGCFATSNRLSKIVFYKPLKVAVYDNAFEGVGSWGEVIVVGEGNAENRAKYDELMSQLGDGWSLNFVSQYNE